MRNYRKLGTGNTSFNIQKSILKKVLNMFIVRLNKDIHLRNNINEYGL